MAFDSVVLRKTFQPKRKEITGGKHSIIPSVDSRNKRSKNLTPFIHDVDSRQRKYQDIGEKIT